MSHEEESEHSLMEHQMTGKGGGLGCLPPGLSVILPANLPFDVL